MNNITLVETNQIDNKMRIVLRQTNYSEETAKEKLQQHGFNEIAVIQEYLGVSKQKNKKPIKSVNQAIYKQLRNHLDTAMKDYKERVDKGEAKQIL